MVALYLAKLEFIQQHLKSALNMDEFSEQLISKVQNHPYLYDDQHKEYKNLNSKEQAWKKIGEELKMSPIKVKARWKNLRDSYVKYKNQLNKVRDAAEQEAVNNRYLKWTGRSYLSFLDETLARRSHSSSLVHLKSENDASPPPIKRAKSIQHDDDGQSYKKVKTDRVKKKSQSKIRSTLNALTTKLRQEKAHIRESLPIEKSSLLVLNAKVEELNIPPDNCLEISTTNGMATKDGIEAISKSNETDIMSHYLEDKRNHQSLSVIGGSDAIDYLFSSYAQTFRTLPLRQQVNIKIEMAKLFATAEIESQH